MRALLTVLVLMLVTTACDSDEPEWKLPRVDTGWGGGPLATPLSFHQVRQEQPGACASADELTVDDKRAPSCLHLEPAAFQVAEVVRVRKIQRDGQWQLDVKLTANDGKAFEQLTARAAQEQPPGNRVAVLIGERELLIAPTVQQGIRGGRLTIAGPFSEAEIDSMAATLSG